MLLTIAKVPCYISFAMKNDFAKLVKDTRGKMNLTQEEFSKLLGVKRVTVGHYENGLIKPSADVLIKIQGLARKAA